MPTYRASPDEGVVWITGASAGIGRALAVLLASRGWRVAVTARRTELLLDLEATGRGRITAFPGDVTNAGGMRATFASIEGRLGAIALAVLNAGFYDEAEKGAFDAAVAWRTVEANLGGAIACLDPVLAGMVRRGKGQVALVASLAGYGGIPGSAAYGAAKAGLITLAEALRLSHAGDGITVQVVNPGFVATAMTAGHAYPMPMMMSAEAAAVRIAAGLNRGGFEITFPRRLAVAMKLAGLLPYPLWLPLMARATRRARPTRAVSPDA